MHGDDVHALATPLRDAGDFDPLLDRIGDATVVMLGEASHGTHDYYRWRADLTRRLIDEHGFSFVAVEGDWPDCDRVDRAVRSRSGGGDPRDALLAFDRWPTWMWANEEVSDFVTWLHRRNRGVGFHGLDVYSLWESVGEVLVYLREHDPEGVPAALAALRCLGPYGEDPQQYAFATVMGSSCAPALVELLTTVRQRAAVGDLPTGDDPFRALAAQQNAEAAVGAENYYRAMVSNGPDSWNVRDIHMVNTLDRLLRYYGPSAKAVVWAHNTHIGDARATDMADVGMVNLGQLGRERWGADAVALVGFGCHHGEVLAGPAWGDPMEVMPVPPARAGSLEAVLMATLPEPALFVFPPGRYASGHTGARPAWIADELPHRAIGVVYRPSRESYGNYVPTRLGDRYDAFVWLPETTALRPLAAVPAGRELETFPVGV
ncbi:erythromycin esterase family protein [Cryptosporangium aurantiacum]|uniref:Erythromycin esterase homolog n=1 Tax=Cryptosporangium aurantiacum TaxID=134849 RepID=A0A1M7PTZ9_9ACTN|nr:erythromycin esterase family protein [Cryptosporangium aurantiacum]SHN20976.1 Erythromycin esterase homolog [Cryptosporangium aurantiacum]